MKLFAITTIFTFLFLLLTIIFLVLLIIKPERKIFHGLFSFFNFAVTVFMAFQINIPCPEFYIVKDESDNNTDKIQIKLDENGVFFSTYYTFDKTDPKEGLKYEKPFYISNSTTITAKRKFLLWWSAKSESYFGFEKIHIDDRIQLAENKTKTQDDEQTSESDLAETTDNNNVPDQNQSLEDENLNMAEGYNLMTYINQYRVESGIGEVVWDGNLENAAKGIATLYATGEGIAIINESYQIIGRQCNGAIDAEKAVSDWITGNNYVPSESESLLSSNYTKIGGALYYLEEGNEYGYHYFWVVCLK